MFDLNGELKATATVNFRPDFIRSLGQTTTSASKSTIFLLEIESYFYVANSVGDYKEYTLEIFEKRISEKSNKSDPAMNEIVPRINTDSVTIEYTILEKETKVKSYPQARNSTISSSLYSSALLSHVFGYKNGEIIFKEKFDNKDIVVKASNKAILKLEEHIKESSVIFSSMFELIPAKKSIGTASKRKITYECRLVKDSVVDFIIVKQIGRAHV